MKLILASASERRKELLGWLGLKFEVRESGFDESGIVADDAALLTGALALAKAQTVADQIKAEKEPAGQLDKEIMPVAMDQIYVLGADTVVYLQGEILGKPRDIDHAREILLKLRGQTHEVHTGVSLVDVLTSKHKTITDKTEVSFRDFSGEELEDYLATSESLGKAGAYMINGKAKVFVDEMFGSLSQNSRIFTALLPHPG